MPWEDQIKRGRGFSVPFWTVSVVLVVWVVYERDWFALALVAVLMVGYWAAIFVMTEIIRAGAKEPTKRQWWDEIVENLPHPTEQSHSADVLRHKYRRFVHKIYP
jgi:hypothetical protein